MNPHLVREQTIKDIWLRVPTLPPEASRIVEELQGQGLVTYSDGAPVLTEKGLSHAHSRTDVNSLDDMLGDLNIDEHERRFLAYILAGMPDKPFAYDIIKISRSNPDRMKYPSVDLGSFDDIEHGMLFGARHHIMIDTLLSRKLAEQLIEKLKRYGANFTGVTQNHDVTKINYSLGQEGRKITLVKADAAKLDDKVYSEIQRGIYSLVLKGGGGASNVGNSNVLEALEHYVQFLKEGGLVLSSRALKNHLDRVSSGMLGYWSHVSSDCRFSEHTLYQKRTKH